MSKQDRLDWIARGSPFRLVRPAADLRDRLRRYGYVVYDIGNRDHLEHIPPEDHTPYSATGWPGKAKYGTGYAIDIMPPTKAGLPSLQKLGAQLLADRKAGVPGVKWIKYMNWEPQRDNGGPCYHESWQPTYARRSSSDRGHIHLSGLTGYEDSTIGRGYDPVARIRGKDDMAGYGFRTQQQADDIYYMLKQIPDPAGGTARVPLHAALAKIDAEIDAIAAKLGVDLAAIKASVGQLHDVDEQAVAAAILATLTPEAIAAAIPDELAQQVVTAIGERLSTPDAG